MLGEAHHGGRHQICRDFKPELKKVREVKLSILLRQPCAHPCSLPVWGRHSTFSSSSERVFWCQHMPWASSLQSLLVPASLGVQQTPRLSPMDTVTDLLATRVQHPIPWVPVDALVPLICKLVMISPVLSSLNSQHHSLAPRETSLLWPDELEVGSCMSWLRHVSLHSPLRGFHPPYLAEPPHCLASREPSLGSNWAPVPYQWLYWNPWGLLLSQDPLYTLFPISLLSTPHSAEPSTENGEPASVNFHLEGRGKAPPQPGLGSSSASSK